MESQIAAYDTLKLKDKIESYRKELDFLTKASGIGGYYKNQKILELSMALDEMIVEYMKVLCSAKR